MYNKLKKNLNIEDVFRIAFKNNAAATAIFNLDTTIAMVNDTFCKISGYTREDIIGMSWVKQLPTNELVRLKENNHKPLINHNSLPSKYEFAFYTKQGELKYGYMLNSTLLSHELLVMSFVDITENKRNELLLAKQNEDLKKLIAIRDKDLTLIVSQIVNNKAHNKWLIPKLEELKKLVKSDALTLLTALQNIINKISKQQQINLLKNVNKHFQISYPEFLSDIVKQHPNLTPAEIKLCALLRLNLDTKGIASILNLSYHSIRTFRYRLRKKLNLKTDDNLVMYLMQFK